VFDIGFLNVAGWAPVLYFIAASYLTNVATSLYLHRSLSHRSVEFSPLVAYPMRVWLWLTTGVVTKEWVACHRQHHAYVDREGDPHSPVLTSLPAILFAGWAYYRRAVRDQAMLERYGQGTPDDWLERHVFTKLSFLGVLVLLGVNFFLFGWWGLPTWIAQVILMPVQGGIVNGIGHALGYRNYDIKDRSHNFLPFGLWLVGEELHNNHHADPRSARFRRRWFEIDAGWIYIRMLAFVGVARVLHSNRKLGPSGAMAGTE
jgi:stearoyl-CoA desaturase (delta-9 desaturase)